jgi:hypothetical protein
VDVVSRRRWLGDAWLLATMLPVAAWAQAPEDLARAEIQIKAAYLFRFLGFVDWPPGTFPTPQSPLRFGVLDADALAEELAETVRTRHVEGRPVIARRVRADERLSELHALFVGRGSQARLPALLAAAGEPPLLTITDGGDTPVPGSAINFVTVDNKVRFDVVVPVADSLRVKISSRLIAVARKVVP